jgi:Zn-dependent peptidase ImmA (M78 family)
LSIERRANAFAAMFLMPPELIELATVDAQFAIDDLAGISMIASRLRTSLRATVDHLFNLTLMSEPVRDELLRKLRE